MRLLRKARKEARILGQGVLILFDLKLVKVRPCLHNHIWYPVVLNG